MQIAVHYDELSATLSRMGYTDDPAEYHGILCGALCVRPPEDINLLHLLETGAEPPLQGDDQSRSQLRRLRDESLSALQDREMIFAPVLPEDAVDLGPRVRALAAWCEGFLFGLASKPGLDLKRCSIDAREIIEDFTQFTRATLEEDDDVQLEENAYAELVEYIRIGAQLLFMEFRPVPVPDPTESKQLH